MKLFKRKQHVETSNDDWWKDPRLDDEGTYDYLVEELPSDSAKWEWYYTKCDSCGKDHCLNFCSTHYFYCWDGWDSMSYTECHRCMMRDKIYSVKSKIKRRYKAYRNNKKEYKDLMKAFENKGVEITKEHKLKIKSIIMKENRV